MSPSSKIFNIVYTTGTVAPLAFMVRSLLHWSNCSFRLVSNGCTQFEQNYLRSLCFGESRLEYYELPTQIKWRHGQALDLLRTLSPGEDFGFLDSDIFADGEFMPAVLEARSHKTAVFSGMPVWAPSSEQIIGRHFTKIDGRHHILEPDIEIGCTYFALYDAEAMDSLLQRIPLSFRTCEWMQIPEECRTAIRQLHGNPVRFDTGKLINLMLILMNGAELGYVDLPNLIHIGGISYVRPNSSKRRLRMAWRRLRAFILRKPAPPSTDPLRQKIVGDYFWRLLESLSSHATPPPIPRIAHEEIRTRVHAASAALLRVHRQFAD